MRINGSIIGSVVTSSALSATGVWGLQNVELANRLNIWPAIYVTSGSILILDASNTNSYPGSGTSWYDLSGNGNTGTLVNGPTFSSLNGGSVVFDGTNDCVTLAINSLFNFGTGDFSIFCWIKSSKVSDYSTIFALDDGALGTGILFYIAVTTGVFRTWVANVAQNTAASIANGNWNYVGITRSSGTVYQYINGVQVGSFASAGSVRTNQIPRFGNYDSSNSYMYQGNIAMSQIYNRALTAAEVLQNFNVTRARFGL
jgi:hypothetical protein